MDVLSEVLRAVRLTGAVFFDVSARAPWVAESPTQSSISAKVMPDFERVIPFHIVLDGSCWAQLGEESCEPIRLVKGDAVLLPHGDRHSLGSEAGGRAEPDYGRYYRPDDRPLPFVLKELGGSGASVHLACGFLGCDARPFNPVLDGLPPLLHVQGQAGANPTLELIRMALEESAARRAGSETVLAKLSELMFVQALRRYLDQLPADSGGWLSGLRDPQVGRALGLIHGRPAEDWTLERLAREVALSRSAFAERFSHFVREPAMRYLGRWRMQLALRALESPSTSIAQAASQVGYQSEAAFNRAFKKYMGVPPGQWRRARLE
jgi:AraC-like DNA-binding protein